MLVIFTDQACTANIYTHEFNIACIHVAERLLFRENLSVYTLKIYPLYGTYFMLVYL